MKKLELKETVLPVISGNFEEVKADLEIAVSKYDKIIVTDETLDDCKKMQKELSAIRREIDGRRLDIKREIKKPIDEFDAQMKELTALVISVEDPIKSGISVFTEKEKDEKGAEVNAILSKLRLEHELEDRFASSIPFDPRWLNKTSTLKSIGEEIEAICKSKKIEQDASNQAVDAILKAIETAEKLNELASPITPEKFTTRYVDGRFSLPEILDQVNIAADEQKKAENKAVEKSSKKEEITTPPPRERATPTRSVTIKVTATDEKLSALAQYLKSNDIVYEKLQG